MMNKQFQKMSSKEKTNKITSFFKPTSTKVKEKHGGGGDISELENRSIIANKNDQASKSSPYLFNFFDPSYLADWTQEKTR